MKNIKKIETVRDNLFSNSKGITLIVFGISTKCLQFI